MREAAACTIEHMERLRLVKVGGVPEIVVVGEPLLPSRLRAAIETERQQIAASEHEFDGPVQIVLRADDDRLVVADVTYAWWKVLRRAGEANPYPWGALGVCLLLYNDQQEILWARRSSRVSFSGVWGFSASGAVGGGSTPEQSLLEEAQEEIGLGAADLEALTPLFTVRGAVTGGDNGVLVVYRAQLAAGAVIRPDAHEVDEVVWQPSPEGLEPLGSGAQLVWEMCRRRGFLDPRFLSPGSGLPQLDD